MPTCYSLSGSESATTGSYIVRRLPKWAIGITRRTKLEPPTGIYRTITSPHGTIFVENLLPENGIVGLGVGTVLCFDTHSSDVNKHDLLYGCLPMARTFGVMTDR